MRRFRSAIPACLVLALAACGGEGDLSIELPGEREDTETGEALTLDFPAGQAVEHRLPFRVSGGVAPYESAIDGCPDWVTLFADQGVLAGSAPASERGRTFFCAYRVSDSGGLLEPRTVSWGLRLAVGSPAALDLPSVTVPALMIGVYRSVPFPAATGGVAPNTDSYTYSFTCAGGALPSGMGFAPATRRFAGTPDATFQDSCTYTVTDSAQPAASVSRAVEVKVDPLERGSWRFRTRTVAPGGPCTLPNSEPETRVAILPHAQGGEAGDDVYRLIDFPEPNDHFLRFDSDTRQLTYIHQSAVPILGTPNTYRYLVGPEGVNAENADDVLCLDIQFDPGTSAVCPADPPLEPSHFIHIHLRVRDDAFWDQEAREYRCPDTTAPAPRSAPRSVSNPVHIALAPVHARRAVEVAHDAVRDRVRGWSPGARNGVAVSPSVDFASLAGRSAGFDYTGSSRSVSGGVDFGAGSWQAGLVAAFTRTDLRYRAAPGLSRSGYRAGEHDTEIFSVHPFAAWHVPSGAKLWTALGAGAGDLRHRDELGFPSWSGSDVRLRAYALGASVPVASVLSGELQAEAGFESFAFEVEGGDRISSALPTLRGRDYRAGLAWSAPVRGAPSLSMAWKQLTGDGPEGARLETRGSVSFAGLLHPRLSVTGRAGASFDLGDRERESWRLGAGIRFAPDIFGRGFGLDLDTGLVSPADGPPSADAVRGEVGYGLWGGTRFRTVRPYAGLTRQSGGDTVRRSLGVDIGDWPDPRLKAEVYDDWPGRRRGFALIWRRRF